MKHELDKERPHPADTRPWHMLASVGIGVLTVTIANGSLWVFDGAPLNLGEEWAVLLFQIIWVSIPFLLLTFLGVASRIPWLVGIALTAGLWGYVIYGAAVRRGDGTGANIGLGILLMVSPILISTACLFAARRELRRSSIASR